MEKTKKHNEKAPRKSAGGFLVYQRVALKPVVWFS